MFKMKRLILFMFLLISGNLIAQENRQLINNFIKNEKNIICWQNISDTELSQAELLDAIIESGFYQDIEVTGDKVICVMKPYKVNYEQYGYSALDASSYILQNLITATVIFEFKNRRYRSTVKNIQLILNTEQYQGSVLPLEFWVLNRQQDIKFAFFKNGSEVLNKDFLSRTTFNKSFTDW